MKIHLKFDHTQKDALKAIDYAKGGTVANEEIITVMEKYLDDDDMTKQSQLAELVHNELDYEVILFLAVKSMEDKMHKLMAIKLKREIDDLFDSL